MLKTPLYIALRNLLNKTVFDAEFLMTQSRQFYWSVFVSEKNGKIIIRW